MVLDTTLVGRRPGTMSELTREVGAPSDFGTDVMRVEEGQPLTLDLRLESVVEGVLVTGSVRGTATGACVRCLDPVAEEVDGTFQELFVYAERHAHHHEVGDEDGTRSYGSRTVSSTSTRCSGTRWCLHCRSSRYAGPTAPGCAPSAASRSRTTRSTSTT